MTFANLASTSSGILRHIPGDGTPWVDDREDQNATPLRAYLDMDIDESALRSLSIPDRVLEKWGRLFDIVKPNSRRTCCFTRGTVVHHTPTLHANIFLKATHKW